MNITLKQATPKEQEYVYSQSHAVDAVNGCYGHLRTDFDTGGNSFISTWDNHGNIGTDDNFRKEFDTVINRFRNMDSTAQVQSDGQFRNVDFLKSRAAMQNFCAHHPECCILGTDGRQYALRADTEQNSYLLRLNPNKGEYNLYCYCYPKDALDQHLSDVEKGIRIIDTAFNLRFKIEDGDKLLLTDSSGKTQEHTCKVIDSCHFEFGSKAFELPEFARFLEDTQSTVVPLRKSLPLRCYSQLASKAEIVILKRGETGYYETGIPVKDTNDAKLIVDELNQKLGVSKAQAAAMSAGSLFGFHVPAADPKRYDDNGIPIKPQKQHGDHTR